MAKLSDFMVSRVRSKLLKIFLSNPSEMYYVRELTRMAKEEINAVRRELSHMQEKGMIKSEQRGNRLYYQFKETYPFFLELLAIVSKTTGLGKQIIQNRSKLGFIKLCFISTKFVRKLKRDKDDIDLLIVGKVIMPQINLIVKQFEEAHSQEINYSCMTEDEFTYRLSRKDPFITNILVKGRITLIGDDTVSI